MKRQGIVQQLTLRKVWAWYRQQAITRINDALVQQRIYASQSMS